VKSSKTLQKLKHLTLEGRVKNLNLPRSKTSQEFIQVVKSRSVIFQINTERVKTIKLNGKSKKLNLSK